MKLLLAFLLLPVYIMAKEPCIPEEQKLLIEKRIDLDTKSLKGWVRLLKNRSKQGEYGVTLNRDEVQALIKCITEELEYRKRMGKLS